MPIPNPVYTGLIEDIKSLPENYTAQVLDFVGFLKEKAARQESGYQDGCSICAKLRDPETGKQLYNAETIAAFEEGDAILRGDIPAKRYSSLKEMLVDLDSDD